MSLDSKHPFFEMIQFLTSTKKGTWQKLYSALATMQDPGGLVMGLHEV